MKILLIQPFGNETATNYPPIGLLYIASYVREQTDSLIRVLDLRVSRTPIEEKMPEIAEWSPDLVGITGMSVEWGGIKHILGVIRETLGEKVILVAGGPHATVFSDMVMQQTSADYVVRGEGEETFLNLVGTLQEGRDPRDVQGIVLRGENGAIVETPSRELIENLDSLPFPAYDLIDVEDYFIKPHVHNNLTVYKRILPLITARGCPFRCSFCYHMSGFKFRPRSPGNILGEIERLIAAYGVQEFHIEDDIFNFNKPRAVEVMKRIEALGRNLAIAFPNGLKYDFIDEEVVEHFKRAGVYRISLGIESAAPRVQKMVNKPVDLKKIDHVIDLLNNAGISSHGFFMIGFPDETEEEIVETINYAVHSRLATANFSLVKIFPKTPLGEKLYENVSYDDEFSFTYYSATGNASRVSGERLKKLERKAYIDFFSRPSRILRIWKTSPSKLGIFSRAAFTVLSLILRVKTKL